MRACGASNIGDQNEMHAARQPGSHYLRHDTECTPGSVNVGALHDASQTPKTWFAYMGEI
jgi:hypothetical protein